MTNEEYDQLLENLNNYKQELDFSEREKEDYITSIIDYIEEKEEDLLSDDITLEDIFDELKEDQDYQDGGWREDMYPDVDENGEEYPEDYNPYDNDAYCNHKEVLDEIAEFFIS